jgi:hypothetical protein
MKVQLYINGIEAELFRDEVISLTSSIQKIKDIGKIFTDFSKGLTLPASPSTNKIFKHFHRSDISNSYDARFRTDAVIKLNGVDFKEGTIKLDNVVLKDNKPFSYNITFFGKTVLLKDLFGEDELSDLPLSVFNHNYTSNFIKAALTNGYVVNEVNQTLNQNTGDDAGDLIYPFISSDKKYYYSTDIDTNNKPPNNIYKADEVYDENYGIDYKSLKPAIRVLRIIEAIENKYNLEFSTDFFNYSNEAIKDLMLWLHRDKGTIFGGKIDKSVKFNLNEFAIDGADEVREADKNLLKTLADKDFLITYDVSSNAYKGNKFIVIDDLTQETLAEIDKVNGGGTINVIIKRDAAQPLIKPILYVEGEEVNVITATVTIKEGTFNFNADGITLSPSNITTRTFTFDNETNTASLAKELTVNSQMPKMKVMDFLTTIFKLFNLTAYYEDSTVIVKTLDDYYSDRNEYDITQYVDASTTKVEKSIIYSNIEFKFKDPKTFLTLNRSRIIGADYGSLLYEAEDGTFDGSAYKIEVGFEKMLFERMSDQFTRDLTTMGWGWMANENEEPTIGAPLLFYAVKEDASNGVMFNKSDISDLQTLTSYIRPSNSTGDRLHTLNFGSEIDEFDLQINANSLYKNYYNNTITEIYEKNARVLNITAYLPFSLLYKYKLNDTMILRGVKYKIDTIKTNLTNGKSELKLFTQFY